MNTLVDFNALALDRLAFANLGEVLRLARVWGHGQRFGINFEFFSNLLVKFATFETGKLFKFDKISPPGDNKHKYMHMH